MEEIKLDKYSFCLSCNFDRYLYLSRCFNKVGLKQPRLHVGVMHRKYGHIGCSLGHISLIMMARTLNLPYCVVFEDDAYPRPDVTSKFDSISNELEDNHIHWDILSLGRNGEISGFDDPDIEKFWYTYKTDQQRNSLSSKVKNITSNVISIPKNPNGSHAYVIKKSAYSEWIDILTHNNFVDICMGSDNFKNNTILWTKELLFCQKQIDNKCMTNINSTDGNNCVYLYPYNYNINYSGCVSIHKEPPKGFVDNL